MAQTKINLTEPTTVYNEKLGQVILPAGEHFLETGCIGGFSKMLYATSTNNNISNTASTTVSTFTIPANTLIDTNVISGKMFISPEAPAGRTLQYALKIDSTYMLYGEVAYTTNATGTIDILIGAKNGSNAQVSSMLITGATQPLYKTAETTIDMTSSKTLTFEIKWSTAGGIFDYNNVLWMLNRN